MNGSTESGGAGDALERRMALLGIREEDLRETFVRSGGHGGQNVNKVSTCVQLVHLPTGIQVRCQEERLQGRNRRRARELLVERLEARREAARATERARIEKLRRARRGRSRGAKERILADKARQSARKGLRRRPGTE
ncbi:MAG: peptide chain release factor-like protein [Verrucomicrobiales bacterium]|nr:peptide chain release factor-like protein [Verrucomicrobiales bacterium]